MARASAAGRTVLVVEDHAISREGLGVVLRGEGFTVLTARNGREALDHLNAGAAPDLILLDMVVPGLDGWHFLREVRRERRLSLIPIIVMTGTALTREWAEMERCAGFLHKPIEPQALLEEIHRCLQ